MKVTFLILVMVFCVNIAGYAQTNDDIFIIGTSIQSPSEDKMTGLRRLEPRYNDKLYESPSYTFILRSTVKDYYIWFSHYNYKQSERLKIAPYDRYDYMRTVVLPRNDLNKFNLIDADNFIKEKSQAQAWQWAKDVCKSDKRIWIIDRNDFFIENGVEKMILYEVFILETNDPSEISHPKATKL